MIEKNKKFDEKEGLSCDAGSISVGEKEGGIRLRPLISVGEKES